MDSVSRRQRIAVAVTLILVMLATPVFAFRDAGAADDAYTFSGKGWGHGVGMSQWGAFSRAEAGQSSQQILAAYYPGTRLETSTMPGDIRVLLSTTNSVTFTPTGQLTILDHDVPISVAPPGSSVRVAVSGSRTYSITVNGANVCPGPCSSNHLHLRFSQGQPVKVSSTGFSYKWGELSVRWTASGQLWTIIDGLTMQQYLYGLAEVPPEWPNAALDAQAIAGRSFAMATIERRRNSSSWTSPFDLYSSVQDQAYAGTNQEVARWKSAVDRTIQRIVTYDGEVIEAFYSASHGGHSEDSGYVFANSFSYLPAKPDPFDTIDDPNATWTRTYSTADLSRWLGRYGDTSVGTVTGFSISGNIGKSGRLDKANITITGTKGTRTVTGSRFMAVVNDGIRVDGGGYDRRLLSTWFSIQGAAVAPPGGGGGGGTPVNQPVASPTPAPTPVPDSVPSRGWFDRAGRAGTDIAVAGWALDPDTPNVPVQVEIFVDGVFRTAVTASSNRPDVAEAFGTGGRHGFSTRVAVPPGTHTVCVEAKSSGRTSPDTSLGCKTVAFTDAPPVGWLDRALPGSGGVNLAGWAADGDDPGASVRIRVWVNGALAAETTAASNRPDVDAATGLGANHGFSLFAPTGPGTNSVCVYARNIGTSAGDTLLGCRTVDTSGSAPTGWVDRATDVANGVRIDGWALDADTPGTPVVVDFSVDGRLVGNTTARSSRPDVGAALGLGSNHGFSFVVPDGSEACVSARDTESGTSRRIGCIRL